MGPPYSLPHETSCGALLVAWEGLGHGVGIVKGLYITPLRAVDVGPRLPAVKGDGAPGTC